MKRPLNRGAAVDETRYARWLAEFAGYRNPVTRGMVELWLRQFSAADQDLAARILDAVLFIGNQKIHTSFRELLNSLEGWDKVKSRRRGRWFFVPFSGSTGESGDSMLHSLRMSTSMSKKQYNNLFIHRSELVSKQPSAEDTVVLVDDFSGTGTQACDSWHIFEELLTGGPRVVLMLIAATESALARITDETEMEPICAVTLTRRDNLFQADCVHFNEGEKDTILGYCATADRRYPRGFGEAGLLLVLAHRTPNDTIPILHATHDEWHGLFPRHD
ncbi:MAG TPA: hypothetical protein VFA89_10390 [Terriglobales bacterium]|nr:hypothetical protein [Terriglobales bacterium]